MDKKTLKSAHKVEFWSLRSGGCFSKSLKSCPDTFTTRFYEWIMDGLPPTISSSRFCPPKLADIGEPGFPGMGPGETTRRSWPPKSIRQPPQCVQKTSPKVCLGLRRVWNLICRFVRLKSYFRRTTHRVDFSW